MFHYVDPCDSMMSYILDKVDAVFVMAGDTAKLPCDVTIPNANDRVKLVLWFRNFSDSPFYT